MWRHIEISVTRWSTRVLLRAVLLNTTKPSRPAKITSPWNFCDIKGFCQPELFAQGATTSAGTGRKGISPLPWSSSEDRQSSQNSPLFPHPQPSTPAIRMTNKAGTLLGWLGLLGVVRLVKFGKVKVFCTIFIIFLCHVSQD